MGAVNLVTAIAQNSARGDLPKLALELAETQQPDGGWKEHGASQQSDLDSSVLHHTALTTYLRRVAHARDFAAAYTETGREAFQPSPDTLKALESTVAKSWENLMGEVPANPLQPLSRGKILAQVSLAPALLHEAVLGDSLQVRLEPEAVLSEALTAAQEALRGNELQPQPSRPLPIAKVLGAGLAAAAVIALPGALLLGLAQVVAGAAVGWMVTSANEAMVHEKALHVNDLPTGESVSTSKPKSLVSRIYSKSPEWLQKAIYGTWFGHTKIHHFRTFRHDQVTQFKTTEEKAKLDGYLLKQGREDVIDDEYGLTIGLKGFLTFQGISLPSYVATLGAAFALGAGPLFALGFALPTIGGQYVSKEYHRYTHMPARKALETASFPMQPVLQSSLSRLNVRRHFVHHEDPASNFNLIPGADMLSGKSKDASVAQEEELRRLKVLW